jgi:predicted metal-dependent phosphoesterase TrpH
MNSSGLIDLHIHTSASDGSFSPQKIVELAKAKGLRAISITDHDTIDGNAEALKAGEKIGLEVIPGVEISVEWEERPVHILGYYIHGENDALRSTLKDLIDFREERNPKIIKRLNFLGIDISYEEVKAVVGDGTAIGRPHIAQVLIERGYVKNGDEAFKKYLKRGGAAYVEKRRLTPSEGIELIKAASGIPVLAHPYNIDGIKKRDLEHVVLQFKRMGIEGIETYYPLHNAHQILKLKTFAEKYGLYITGGTDFHGEQKPDIQLGSGFGSLSIPYELILKMKENHGGKTLQK